MESKFEQAFIWRKAVSASKKIIDRFHTKTPVSCKYGVVIALQYIILLHNQI